jgi:fatty acid desaturase
MNQIPNATPYLSIEDRKMLMRKQDWKSYLTIFMNLCITASIFLMVFYWPNMLTILLGLLLLGGQQLGYSVLMHDGSHFSLFKSKKINDFVSNWLGAYLIFNNVHEYRNYHKEHHLHAGTHEDPDLMLTRGYPTNKKSMYRKFFRDFSGQTGFKSYIALFAMHLGFIRYTQSGNIVKIKPENRIGLSQQLKNIVGPLLANLILFLLLTVILHPLLYLLWIVALLTTFQVSVRVRSIAEHSILEDVSDPNKNTRTTYANWIERLLFAPYHVNYHLEHHMLMTVPFYNLPKMHAILKERGYYKNGILADNYWEVLKLAGSSLERNMAKVKV